MRIRGRFVSVTVTAWYLVATTPLVLTGPVQPAARARDAGATDGLANEQACCCSTVEPCRAPCCCELKSSASVERVPSSGTSNATESEVPAPGPRSDRTPAATYLSSLTCAGDRPADHARATTSVDRHAPAVIEIPLVSPPIAVLLATAERAVPSSPFNAPDKVPI
jgi:hypothetical protein